MAQQEQQKRLLEQRLRTGIQAAQQGDNTRARNLLEQVIQDEPNNELAWIWMTAVVESNQQKRVCLQKVLQLNPDNRPAQNALNSLVGILGSSDEINYRAMSRASKTKLSRVERDDSFRAQVERGEAVGEERSPQANRIRLILGVIAVILLIILVASLVPLILPEDAPPTPVASATPRPVIVQPTALPSDTPIPPPGIQGNRVERSTFTPGPSETPLPTQTPSITPTPTSTLPALDVYTVLLVADENGTPNLYRYTLSGEIELLGRDIRNIAYETTQNQVAFLRDVADDEGETITQVFLGELDNLSEATSITRLPDGSSANSVTLAPDGTQVIYSANQDGDDDLYLYDISTGVARNLTQNETSDIQPQWLTDDLVIFAADRDSPLLYEIYILDLSDNSVRRVTDTRGTNTQPSLSPDAERIAYVNQPGSDSYVLVTDLDGRRNQRVTRADDVQESNPEWTPDGVYLMFTSRSSASEDAASSLYVVRPEQREPERFDMGLDVIDLIPISRN